MDANVSAPRYVPSVPLENGSSLPPYPYPYPLHSQFTHPPPPLPQSNPFNVSNPQRFDANWLASLPPPPPPIPFAQLGSRPPFDASGHPLFPQIPFPPPHAQTSLQTAVAHADSPQQRLPTPSKENAKEAILALFRADITYNDLVAEGVKAPLLDALFTELNLPLPKPAANSPEVLDPAMERKDRIAKLLAAKKNQGAVASPKETAQLIEPVTTPELASRNHTPLPPAPLPLTKQIPQQEAKTDFSIPGLFMTSAEQEEILPPSSLSADLEAPASEQGSVGFEDNDEDTQEQVSADPIIVEQDPASVPEVENVLPQPVIVPQAAALEVRSLKRGPEPFSANIMPEPKRQVSMSQETAPLSDSERTIDTVLHAGRSKVNQNILKDRMAALKADLLLKNSRKKALQDGMPVLNAEVQKTRERLEDNETRLRDVRVEIKDRTAELDRLREEEIRLQDEVQRLKDQLADGETGQQQFSKELTQLNDQIMADEDESRVSQTSTLLSSPVTARTDIPVQQLLAQDTTHSLVPKSPSRLASQPQFVQERDINVESQQVLTAPTQHEIQPPETEYSLEQEDLDRQLNQQVTYTEAQIQPRPMDTLGLPHAPNGVIPSIPEATTTVSDEESEHDSEDDRMSIDEADEADEVESIGSASMSDSGSDEYEPPIHLDPSNEVDYEDADDDYEPQEMNIDLQEASNEVENDDYEPSEQVDVLNVDALEVMRRDEDAAAAETAGQPPNDISAGVQVLPATEEIVDSSPHDPEKQLTMASSPEAATHDSLPVSQLEPLSNNPEGVHVVPHFVPYSSPLSNMKQFRFNPQFNDIVKDGYRSLTYSHQIDKDTPLCPTELSGTVCTDGDCEEQHFSRFALSGMSSLPQAG